MRFSGSIATVLALASGTMLSARSVAAQTLEPLCYEASPAGTVTRELTGGYEASLTRSDSAHIEDGCLLVVTIGNDTLVRFESLRTAMFGDGETDFTGDGNADPVLAYDDAGGNRCCWHYVIVSLTPVFDVIIDLQFAPIPFDDGGDPRLLKQIVPFYDLGPYMAAAPIIVRALRLEEGRLVDETRSRCADLLDDRAREEGALRFQWARLSPEGMRESKESAQGSVEIEETRAAARSIVMQNLYCGRDGAAREFAARVWPAGSIEEEIDALGSALRTRVH